MKQMNCVNENDFDEYEVARQVAAEATQVYFAAAAKYRAREISDAEYLAARATYKAADKAFDVAYAKVA